jgi:hypothetical protein
MGERFSRAEQLEHRVQMLLGVFSTKGVLPLEFKPAHSVGDLLTQHLDELEREAEHTGGASGAHGSHGLQVSCKSLPRGVLSPCRPLARVCAWLLMLPQCASCRLTLARGRRLQFWWLPPAQSAFEDARAH